MRERNHYKKEFKKTIVELLSAGQSVKQVSSDYELKPDIVRRWRREFASKGDFGIRKELSQEEKELRLLKRELKDVTEERDILKKAISIFSKKGS
jgi:transposase